MLEVIAEVLMRYAVVGLMVMVFSGCSDGGGGVPSPTPQVSATPVGETQAASPTSVGSPTPGVSPTPDQGASPTTVETPSATSQIEPSATMMPTGEMSPSENFSPTPGSDVSDSPTAGSDTPPETDAPTGTLAPTGRPTEASPTVGVTPGVTPTAPLPEETPTAQPTAGMSPTLPPTAASTPTVAPTPTTSPTQASTPTLAPTPTGTPTLAPTPTQPPTPTPPVDGDNDGFWAGDDCDDTDGSTYPGALELCDGVDNNCDGDVDEGLPGTTTWYEDQDEDTYGNSNASIQSCVVPDGYVENSLDCDDNEASIIPGSAPSCPVVSCQEAVDLGIISTTGSVWIQPAADVVEVMCTFGSLPQVLGITSSESVSHLTWMEIGDGCVSGLQPYRYLSASYVDEAVIYTAEENLAEFYLLNSFAGPHVGCPALATRDGYLRPDGRWFDDDLELSWWGLDISSNCNQDEFDPIPMASGVGPRSTSGDTFLYSASESSATYPVLCMEIYDRDGDGSDTTTDCDDGNAQIAPDVVEVLDLIDNNCDGVIDEGTANTSCLAIHQANATLPSGTYNVDPDGTGPATPFRVYCDMDYDGGGWTLVSQGIPVVNNSLSLCSTAAVGSLNLDGTTVTAPAKLADTTINSLWSSRREWLVTADAGSSSSTRSGWPRACVVDFKSSFDFVGPITQNIALTDLDSTTLKCTGQAWGDSVINDAYGPAGLFCGYRYVDTSSGSSGSNNAWYLLYSAVTTYAGGTCGTATAGRSWLSTGNWGCNVTKMWVR